jgi:hypothetical protein
LLGAVALDEPRRDGEKEQHGREIEEAQQERAANARLDCAALPLPLVSRYAQGATGGAGQGARYDW